MSDSSQDRAELHRRLKALLEFPGESPQVDCKAAKVFDPRDDFGRKLVKHVIGMANAGGGYIVIGYTEDPGHHGPDPAMGEDVAKSYDSTGFSQAVAGYVLGDEKPELTVEKVEHQGHYYPVICVQAFARSPFFCRSNVNDGAGKTILRQGALYVRDRHTRTVELAETSQWSDLITLCVRKRQSEMLDVFGKMLADVQTGVPRADKDYCEKFEGIVARERAHARQLLHEAKRPAEGWYFWHVPLTPPGSYDPRHLLDAAESARQRKCGMPIGLTWIGQERAQVIDDGLRMAYTCEADDLFPFWFEEWFLHEQGGFFMYRSHEGGKSARSVSWTRSVWRIGEAVDHCIALYKALGLEMDTEVSFHLVHEGVMNMPLVNTDPRRPWFPRCVCRTEEIKQNWAGTLATLEATRRESVVKLCEKLFMRFDVWDLAPGVMAGVYDQYASSQTG